MGQIKIDFLIFTLDVEVFSASYFNCFNVCKEKVALVQIKKYRFQDITIKSGEVVEWKNLDLDMHSTTSGIWGNDDVGNLWDSGKMTFGKGFKFKFMEAGEYPYFCRIHPAMKGVVRVLDSSK